MKPDSDIHYILNYIKIFDTDYTLCMKQDSDIHYILNFIKIYITLMINCA